MDYFGMPHVPTYFPPEACFLDIPHNRAAIPGSGEDLVAFTYSKDAGELVARSLSLPSWPERSRIVGERINYNELVRLVEKVRGGLDTIEATVITLKVHQVFNSMLLMIHWSQ